MWILHLARLVSNWPSVGFGVAYYWLGFFFFKVKNSWFCVDNLKAGPGTGPAVLPQVHLLSCPEGCPRLLF